MIPTSYVVLTAVEDTNHAVQIITPHWKLAQEKFIEIIKENLRHHCKKIKVDEVADEEIIEIWGGVMWIGIKDQAWMLEWQE